MTSLTFDDASILYALASQESLLYVTRSTSSRTKLRLSFLALVDEDSNLRQRHSTEIDHGFVDEAVARVSAYDESVYHMCTFQTDSKGVVFFEKIIYEDTVQTLQSSEYALCLGVYGTS